MIFSDSQSTQAKGPPPKAFDKATSELTTKTPKKSGLLAMVEIFRNNNTSEFRLMRTTELSGLASKYQILSVVDTETGKLARLSSEMQATELEGLDAKAFLSGIKARPNAQQTVQTETDSIQSKKRIRAISSRAMDAATDAFFELMENNIDHWTYDASSRMLNSLAMQAPENLLEQRREAAEIQVKSAKFADEFRAFFIESLVSFNCEEPIGSESPEPVLELVGPDTWKRHNIEPLLARECQGQTKIEFSQLNQRLGVILDRKLTPEMNVLGPQAIAWTVSSALNETGYGKRQRELLEPIIIADFNNALERLYHRINQIWIGMDILPSIKLEILKSDVA